MNQVENYVKKMNGFTCVTAESILKIGNLMLEAKQKLPESDYQEFLKQTNYVGKSSSVRKWEKIGKSYFRLISIVKILPPYWLTIYKLSGLTAHELDTLKKLNIINPSITAKEIDAELKVPANKKASRSITLNFYNHADAQTISRLIKDIETNYQNLFTLKKSESIKALMCAAISTVTLKLAA